MGFNVVDKTTPAQGQTVDANGSAQVMLYDQFGNPMGRRNQSVVTPTTFSGMPAMGLDGNTILRALRVGDFSTLRTTSEQLLWQDAFEGSTINAFWTQSVTTQTIVQATGVLTLNNSGITTLNTDSIITSQRQYPKYPRNPIYCRFRANLSANPNSHTLVELGLGAPVGVTAIISNGAFFRWTAAGTLVAVTSYNGTENVSPVLLAQGVLSTTSYYYYDVIVDDDYARFIVSDSSGTPIVDTMLTIPLATAYTFAVSHVPSFARVYVDATGGGTVVKLNLASHMVQLLDGLFGATLAEQMSNAMRIANINPTTYAQTSSNYGGVPATITPANATSGYTNLGGEYALATPVTAETPSAVFSFQNPSPYTFYLTGLFIPPPVVATTIAVTGIPYIEWMIAANATTVLMSTGGGQRQGVGIVHACSSAAAAQGSVWLGGGSNAWLPRVPIPILPGLFLLIGGKFLGTTVAGTPGVHRGTITVDGYYN